MKTIKTEDGQTVEISDESYAALVDAAREPGGEALVIGLGEGKYRVNGKMVRVYKRESGTICLNSVPFHINYQGIVYRNDTHISWVEDFERYIGMKAADLRQHHIKPYEVEWRGMTQNEVLAFVAHYDGKIVACQNSDSWRVVGWYKFNWSIDSYAFAHIERDGTIGEPHGFRCTVDAPHKVEGADYEF